MAERIISVTGHGFADRPAAVFLQLTVTPLTTDGRWGLVPTHAGIAWQQDEAGLLQIAIPPRPHVAFRVMLATKASGFFFWFLPQSAFHFAREFWPVRETDNWQGVRELETIDKDLILNFRTMGARSKETLRPLVVSLVPAATDTRRFGCSPHHRFNVQVLGAFWTFRVLERGCIGSQDDELQGDGYSGEYGQRGSEEDEDGYKAHFLLLALALHATRQNCGRITCNDAECCIVLPVSLCVPHRAGGEYCDLGLSFCTTCSGDLVCNSIRNKWEAPHSEDAGLINDVEAATAAAGGVAWVVLRRGLGGGKKKGGGRNGLAGLRELRETRNEWTAVSWTGTSNNKNTETRRARMTLGHERAEIVVDTCHYIVNEGAGIGAGLRA
ncbi:hypothetical protein K438DRAFT_1784806 [Mycena galopus ATCC 62051]|nr:hypothetical protein K438DRAFT_1784806 [Mycena galopus ATCC 62051]